MTYQVRIDEDKLRIEVHCNPSSLNDEILYGITHTEPIDVGVNRPVNLDCRDCFSCENGNSLKLTLFPCKGLLGYVQLDDKDAFWHTLHEVSDWVRYVNSVTLDLRNARWENKVVCAIEGGSVMLTCRYCVIQENEVYARYTAKVFETINTPEKKTELGLWIRPYWLNSATDEVSIGPIKLQLHFATKSLSGFVDCKRYSIGDYSHRMAYFGEYRYFEEFNRAMASVFGS